MDVQCRLERRVLQRYKRIGKDIRRLCRQKRPSKLPIAHQLEKQSLQNEVRALRADLETTKMDLDTAMADLATANREIAAVEGKLATADEANLELQAEKRRLQAARQCIHCQDQRNIFLCQECIDANWRACSLRL